MALHSLKILATDLRGDLMIVDIDDVEIGDIIFMGGHLIRRVWTRPSERTVRESEFESFRVWQGLRLDQPTDGSAARNLYQTAVGQACPVFRQSLPDDVSNNLGD